MKVLQFDLSVIVCCYNSIQRIRPTLEHLAMQKTDDFLKWEIIVIDNNSNDGTSGFVELIWKELKAKTTLKVVQENRPGLSNAREKGIYSANSDILVFCDDDNWFDENYVQTAYNLMLGDSNIGMLGGIGKEIIDGEKPEWFENVKIFYAVGPQNDIDGDITLKKGYVYGAGSIIRKSILVAIYENGFVNQLSGRRGKILVSGDDNEIGYMIALAGYKIFYTSQLRFKHFIPQNRLTVSYLCNLVKGHQLNSHKIKCYEKEVFGKRYNFPKSRFQGLYTSIKQFLKISLALFRSKISVFEFKLSVTNLFYRQYYLLTQYDSLKTELNNVERNLNIFNKNRLVKNNLTKLKY